MNTNYRNIPSGWRLSTVETECNICNNLREPLSEEERSLMQGPYPYYGPTKAVDYLDHFRVVGKYALIGEDGDHFLKYNEQDMTQLVSGQFNVNNHAHIVQGRENCTTEWFYTFFRQRALSPFLTRQGAGRYKLTKASLEKIPFLIPPLGEQAKIHETICNWDNAIDITERLVAAKQERHTCLMQKLLTGKQRLPKFRESWKEVHLRDYLQEVSIRNRGVAIAQVLSVTNDRGFVLPEDQFARSVASSDLSNYKVVRRGQFAYNPSRINVGSWAMLDKFDEGVISPMYVVFQTCNNLTAHFFAYWMQSGDGQQRINLQSQGSVRDTVSFDALASIKISLPPPEEQKAIVKILQTADRELDLLRSSRDALREQKRGLMQQLLTGKVRVKV